MIQNKIPQPADTFTGPVLSGTPTGGVRAERVAAAAALTDALWAAELAEEAVWQARLDAAFGPIGGAS